MATSGTAAIDYDILSIAEEAFERAGLEMRSGYDLRSAMRSLNILTMEWANRGLNLWTIASGTVSLVAGTATYSLPTDTIDLIEHQLRVTSGGTTTDYSLNRISVSDYAGIPVKASTGRPLQIYIQRGAAPQVTVWPVPDQTYTLAYYRLRRIEDSASGVNTMDMPFRFMPALIAGLAFHIAMKRPEAAERVPLLKAYYEEQFQLAADEDRDRASLNLVPFQGWS